MQNGTVRPTSRRETLALLGAAVAAPWLQASGQTPPVLIATNTYPWTTFAKRAGEPCELHSDALLGQIAGTGIRGYEPIINDPAEFDGLGERLKRNGLEMPSLYVNSVLHDPAKADESIAAVIAIAKGSLACGTRIIVTNPSPIRWGSTEDKTDAQLRTQAAALDRLGSAVRDLGLTLAYHNHDAELRQGGREFNHMLTATDPGLVKWCLDAHWIFRGCGDSEVAVFDALTHYRDRLVELHLRQSSGGIWQETFTMRGDIDHTTLFARLAEGGAMPHLVLEQAVEAQSPRTLDAVSAHRISRESLAAALKP